MPVSKRPRGKRAAQLRRPSWERLQERGIEMQINGTITTEQLREMASNVSPDTERNLDQCEVLERCILDLLASKCGYSMERGVDLFADRLPGVGFGL